MGVETKWCRPLEGVVMMPVLGSRQESVGLLYCDHGWEVNSYSGTHLGSRYRKLRMKTRGGGMRKGTKHCSGAQTTLFELYYSPQSDKKAKWFTCFWTKGKRIGVHSRHLLHQY